jgi:hypothetical protein
MVLGVFYLESAKNKLILCVTNKSCLNNFFLNEEQFENLEIFCEPRTI